MRISAVVTSKTDETVARERAVDGDLAFKKAMIAARRRKLENFNIGVDTRPGTECAMQITPLGIMMSRNASPGALCSDIGVGGGRGTKF